MVLLPPVTWAQRKDTLWVTIEVSGVGVGGRGLDLDRVC